MLLSDEEAPAPTAPAEVAQLVAMGFCAERAAEALQAGGQGAGGALGVVEGDRKMSCWFSKGNHVESGSKK